MTHTNRYYFLDVIRGLVLFLMIEVHVINALLRKEFFSGLGFEVLNFINGLVAPTFLFSAGFSFALFYNKKHAELTPRYFTFWHQLARIAFIWIIGYQLHMPFFSLSRIINHTNPEQWLQFNGIDVLQCIAAGLLLTLIFYITFKKLSRINICLLFFALLFLLAAPFFYFTPLGSSLPLPLQVYLKPIHYSYFPLFPWLSFLFLGSLLGNIFLSFPPEKQKNLMRNILIGGAVLALIATPLLFLFKSLQIIKDVKPHALFFLSRLGFVWLIYSFGYFWGQRKAHKNHALVIAGQFSLLVYWLHLQIIYRHYFPEDKSLAALFSHALSIPSVLLITVLIGALMYVTTLGYRWLKNRFPEIVPYITPFIFTGSLIVFLFR